jgi:hypothetical protein
LFSLWRSPIRNINEEILYEQLKVEELNSPLSSKKKKSLNFQNLPIYSVCHLSVPNFFSRVLVNKYLQGVSHKLKEEIQLYENYPIRKYFLYHTFKSSSFTDPCLLNKGIMLWETSKLWIVTRNLYRLRYFTYEVLIFYVNPMNSTITVIFIMSAI